MSPDPTTVVPRIILMDVDGVLRNIIGRSLDVIGDLTGVYFRHDDVDQYYMERALNLPPEATTALYARWRTPGFVQSMPVYAGALEGMRQLQRLGRVFPVTRPFEEAPTWHSESEQWLKTYFDIPATDVFHATYKEYVYGDLLVEDKTSTLVAWCAAHPAELGILRHQRYNADEALPANARRAFDWDEIVRYARDHLG